MNLASLRYFFLALVVAALSQSSAQAQKMYWAESRSIWRADLDGANAEFMITATQSVRDIALDPVEGKMYWVAETAFNASYWRADLNGQNSILLHEDYGAPSEIYLTRQHAYWAICQFAAPTLPRLIRSNHDFSNQQVIQSGQIITGLDVDEAAGKIYWIEPATRGIHRANLDGSASELLITTATFPWLLELDLIVHQMFWIEDDLYVASMEGGTVQAVNPGMDAYEFDLDPTARKIYYSSYYGGIFRVDYDGQNTELLVPGTGAIEALSVDLRTGVCGDCALDGPIPSVIDALIAARIRIGLLPPTELQLINCDVNGSGDVSVLDTLLIAQAVVGLPVVFNCP